VRTWESTSVDSFFFIIFIILNMQMKETV